MLELKIEYLKHVNFVLINSGKDICEFVSLLSKDEDLHDVYVECSGEYFTTTQTSILPLLPMQKKIHLSDFQIKPDAKKMAQLTERVKTTFSISVWAEAQQEDTKRQIAHQEFEIDLMPFDFWLGTSILPQSLASFVTPNHPAISQMVVKAAKYLKGISGHSSFVEYQSGSPTDVVKQVGAVFAALHDENIVYRALPASFETAGQRVTLPDQVLTSKLGNCVEVTILFASILEAIGLHAGIILQEGHAYLAVWLVDDCCQYSVCDDVAYIEKKCSEGINEMMVLESTMITGENVSFDNAIKAAKLSLADISKFQMMIDIRRCRLEGFYPLPQRVLINGTWDVQDIDGVKHDGCLIDIKEHSRYDLSQIIVDESKLNKMDIWERKLLDFSLRNSMLNLRLRQRAIQLISFNIDKLEDHLQQGEEYVIIEKPDVEIHLDQNEKLIRSKLYPTLESLIDTDIKHRTLHTFQTELETKSTLKNIYRAARNAIEETGANSLFLTIGALRWYETEQSENARFAPILMLPVEMVYKKGQYSIRATDEDIMLNVTLIEFLRQTFDIKIPELNLLPKDESGVDVSLVFTIIRDALKNQKRWDVEEESILGVFSFSKYLMWNDIHNHRNELLQNKIIESLVEQRLTWQPDTLGSTLRDKDKIMPPAELALPVPADSSQMAAVFEAGQGHSFILYGPPGTGKSQTITNLIANALFQGKRVLFVAEKMAALSVVQNRLAKIGLDPFCLEMHSNKATKRHILDQLGKALNVTRIISPEEYARTADELYAERKKLIAYMEALHEQLGEDGFSLYECILHYEEQHCKPFEGDILTEKLRQNFTKETLPKYEHLLGGRLVSVMSLVDQPSKNGLLGLNIEEQDLANESTIRDELSNAKETLLAGLANIDILHTTKQQKEDILRGNTAQIFNLDAEVLYQDWRKAKSQWFLPRWFSKRAFLKKLRTFNPYIVESEVDILLGSLITYQKQHRQIGELQQIIVHFFDLDFKEDELPSKEVMEQLIAKFNTWRSNLGGLRDWYQWCAYRKELINIGMSSIVDIIEHTEVNPSEVLPMFKKSIFMALTKKKISESPALRTFEGIIFDDSVAQYKKLTEKFQMLSQKQLYAKLAAQVPRVTSNVSTSSEIGFVNRNISNGGRGVSMRDLLDQIPTLLPKLCPCMLMSPMSVAQYLSLTQDKFDLVIFDEASQMPTSEAVGSIARGKALIVVGDPKQMPPTSFFTSTNVNDDEADIDDLESILEDCRTLEIPSLQLNWHYRSQHESLIAFSNNEYYEGSLITFPSIDDQKTKVKYVPIQGVYDKGGKRSNKAEAEAIVKEIERRLLDPALCQHSIGVIAFSVMQQNLIEDILQDRLDSNKTLREAADNMYEPIFVKNLENVQGDERDIILFSIGYGPDKSGKVSMNFGPLNNKGGERRLNVAVSRARQEMIVFSTLKASQIDLRRSDAKGVEGLKHFLEYAEQQILIQTESMLVENVDTIIAQEIAKSLTDKGYHASVCVGRSQFKVDVAVSSKENENIYLLGILLDGEGYHKTQTTRDREIVQPSVLSNLKWQVMRVWSVDWFNNPERVIKRIIARIESATTAAPEKTERKEFHITQDEIEPEDEPQTNAIPYVEYVSDNNYESDGTLIQRIIETEQPITLAQLCKRVCNLRGEARVTPTMLHDFANYVKGKYLILPDRKGYTIWLSQEAADNYVSYRPNSGRDITDIPVAEIKNVILEALKEQFSITTDALSLIAAKKLGFARRGSNVDEALNLAINQLISDGQIQEREGKVNLV